MENPNDPRLWSTGRASCSVVAATVPRTQLPPSLKIPFEHQLIHLRTLPMQSNLINSTLVDGGDTARCDKYVWNPLSVDPVASQFSSYAAVQDTTVVRPLVPGVPVDAELIDAHDQLRQQIAGDYPCTGAISVFAQKGYRFGLFPELACDSAVRAVCHDLMSSATNSRSSTTSSIPSSRCSADPQSNQNSTSRICFGVSFRPCTPLIPISLPGTRASTPTHRTITFRLVSAVERCSSSACTPKHRVSHAPSGIPPWCSTCMNSLSACALAESLRP